MQLRRRREQLGLSRRALAQRASCAEVTLLKIERDERTPSHALAIAIVRALALDPDAERALLAALPRPQRAAEMPMSERVGRYLALAEIVFDDFDTPRRAAALDTLAAEFDALCATVEWQLRSDAPGAQLLAGKLTRFWNTAERRARGLNLLKSALMLDAAPSVARAHALYGCARLLLEIGDIDTAHKRLREALALCERCALPALRVNVLIDLARVAFEHGRERETGDGYMRQAFDYLERSGQRDRLAFELSNFAAFPLDDAMTLALRANELAASSSSLLVRGNSAHALGKVLSNAGQMADAIPHLERAIQAFGALRDPAQHMWSLWALAVTYLKLGDTDAAHREHERALALFQTVNQWHGICMATHGLGEIARLRGDRAAARRHFLAAYRAAHDIQFYGYMCAAAYELAEAALDDGDQALAIWLLAYAERLLENEAQIAAAHLRAKLDGKMARARALIGDATLDAKLRAAPAEPPNIDGLSR